MVKKLKKRQRKPKISKTSIKLHYNSKEKKEKIFLALFLVFAIIAIMVLFRAEPPRDLNYGFMGASILSSTLEEKVLDPNEFLDGSIKLQLEEDDVLPAQTIITYKIIVEDAVKCSEKYVCPNGKTVSWHKWNEETKECEVEDYDPETMCCRIYPESCKQAILDSGFERSGNIDNLRPDWSIGSYAVNGVLPTAMGLEFGGAYYEYGYSAYTDSLDMLPTAEETHAIIYQELEDRKMKICGGTATAKSKVATSSNSAAYEPELTFGVAKRIADTQLEWSSTYYSYTGEPWYFEIVITSENGNNLHYYYKPFGSTFDPSPTQKHKWEASTEDIESDWFNETINLCDKWAIHFPTSATTDVITKIQLISHGYKDVNEDWFGQKVYWDNIKLTKTGEITTNLCTKKCCLEGTGYDDYYGQLECQQGYECWSKCTQSAPFTLRQFILQSTTPGKYNKVEDNCQFVSDGSVFGLDDLCYVGGDGVGKGYSACTDTSSSSPIYSCRDWNNIYEVNFDRLHIKAPAENGTYKFDVQIAYEPTWYEEACDPDYSPEYCEPILMYETSQTFYVGEEPELTECIDIDYNWTNATNWSDWSDCIAGLQTRTRTSYYTYIGTEDCPAVKEEIETESQSCGILACTSNDWDCTQWTPTVCPKTGIQQRTCTLTGTCDPTYSGSYVPDEERTCVPAEKPSNLGWLIWLIAGLVVIAIVILVVQKFVMQPKRAGARTGMKKTAYSELTSYIKDALATGATRAEIRKKLAEAGWPQDSINAAFRALK